MSTGTIKKDSGFGVAQLILFISIAVLVIFVAWQVLLILFNAFFVDGSFNSHDFYAVLTEPETFQALINSLIIASMTTIGSTIVGTFFAWLVTRTDLPYKNFMKSLFLVPFMLPSFIGTLAWKMLLSPNSGYINKFFIETFGFSGPVFDIYTYHGISAVEVMYLFPFVFIQVCGALERMDPTLKESACISGAGLFTITRKITIPLVMPSIMSGALLIMLYSMAHFGTVAESIRTGTVLATVLVVSAACIIWAQQKILSNGHYQIIGGKSFRPMELTLRGLRYPLLFFCLAYIAFTILLPTAVIFLVGGVKTYGLPFTMENLSLDNYKYILFEYEVTKDAIFNSISLGLAAAIITMFAGVMISYVIVKMKLRGKGILEFLGMLPFSVPGSVIALGVILAWSGQFGVNLYNTVWIILVAYIARYMAFSLKANSAALEQVHDSLMEASRSCGATMWQSLKDIVIPLVKPGMISAFFLIFLPALRELTVSIMLYAPTTRTIGVAIYTLNEDGETVMSTALAGIALILIVVGQMLINRFTKKVEG